MIALLGSLLGFFSGFVPELLKIWNDRSDKKHELMLMQKQIEATEHTNKYKLEAINVESDIREKEALYKHDSKPSGIGWIDGLRASVRPVITYSFFILFAAVKVTILIGAMRVYDHMGMGVAFIEAMPLIWDSKTEVLFAAIISFWFGSRAINKVYNRSN